MERHIALIKFYSEALRIDSNSNKTKINSTNNSQLKNIDTTPITLNKNINIVDAEKKCYIIDCVFGDWKEKIQKNSNVFFAKNIEDISNNVNNKIIPLSLRDMIKYYNDDRLIYRTDIESMKILDNKCLFAVFM